MWPVGVRFSAGYSVSLFGKGTANMRVINAFFPSPHLVDIVGLVKSANVGPATFSDVKDCASLLLRMLDLPNEPSPT